MIYRVGSSAAAGRRVTQPRNRCGRETRARKRDTAASYRGRHRGRSCSFCCCCCCCCYQAPESLEHYFGSTLCTVLPGNGAGCEAAAAANLIDCSPAAKTSCNGRNHALGWRPANAHIGPNCRRRSSAGRKMKCSPDSSGGPTRINQWPRAVAPLGSRALTAARRRALKRRPDDHDKAS